MIGISISDPISEINRNIFPSRLCASIIAMSNIFLWLQSRYIALSSSWHVVTAKNTQIYKIITSINKKHIGNYI